jgi:putative addiction module killer protein
VYFQFAVHRSSRVGSEAFGTFRAKAFIQARIERVICGNTGDVRPVGAGVSELRIHYGPGYRVYFQQRGSMLVILLAGGDKSTQAKDIKSAQDLAQNFKEDE